MAALRLFSRCLLQNKCDITLNNGSVSTTFNRFLNYLSREYNEKDPAPLFFNKEIQSLLKSLTRINLNKVYKKRALGDKKLDLPIYKFVTDSQLKEMMQEAEEKANVLLQMPPVVKIRCARDRVLSMDPAIQGHDTVKYIFTDITFGITNDDRLIVVRETDGTLRDVDWSLRDRMNQTYFPIAGRELKKPLMFEDKYLESLLFRKEYEFILDRSCIQFEPNDPDYQRVTSITYQYINDNNGFDILRSTRHFGPLSFFLIWHKEIDNLLLDLIQTSYITEANTVLQLFEKFHDVELNIKDMDNTDAVEKYIKEFSTKRASLELALQAYKELDSQRKAMEQDIKHAHGLV